jgi:hypothetical protein
LEPKGNVFRKLSKETTLQNLHEGYFFENYTTQWKDDPSTLLSNSVPQQAKKMDRVFYSPSLFQGMRQREQWAMSNALAGYGNLLTAMIPKIAGTPLSSANCI